jgi:hypothetical protein
MWKFWPDIGHSRPERKCDSINGRVIIVSKRTQRQPMEAKEMVPWLIIEKSWLHAK